MKKIEKEVNMLALAAKERNTKKEIKESAAKLGTLISKIISEETVTLFQTLSRKEGEVKNKDHTHEESLRGLENKIKELEIQNDKLKEEIDMLRKQEYKLGQNRETMKEEYFTQNYEDFERVVDMIWPPGLYQVVETKTTSPLQAGKGVDILITEDKREDYKANEGIWRAVMERHPDLMEVEGSLGAIVVTTKLMGKEEVNDKWFIKAEVTNIDKEWFETIAKVNDMLEKGGRRKFAIYPPEYNIV